MSEHEHPESGPVAEQPTSEPERPALTPKPATGSPARGYSWPPFEKGNTIGPRFDEGNEAAVRHGYYSVRKVV